MTSTPPTGRRSTPSSKITQNIGGCSRVRIDWRSMRARTMSSTCSSVAMTWVRSTARA